ncbi:hypothetical protein KUCAC02_030850, partial [Chaenocephalus aceratus]
ETVSPTCLSLCSPVFDDKPCFGPNSLRPLLVLDHQYLYKPIIMSPDALKTKPSHLFCTLLLLSSLVVFIIAGFCNQSIYTPALAKQHINRQVEAGGRKRTHGTSFQLPYICRPT